MRKRYIKILIFALPVSLIFFLVFTCSKKSTKQEPTPSFCSVAPVTLDFDTVIVNEYSEKSFVLRNSGKDTLSGTISESCSDFSITSHNAEYALAPGESLTVIVKFQPDSTGHEICVIETGNSACSDVNCSGTGGKRPCSVYPNSIDFGIVTIGSSADTSFVITNVGGGVLSCDVNELCGDFSIVSGAGACTLTTGQSHKVTIRFEPDSVGNRTCTFETSNDICEDVLCVGVGEPAPGCSIHPKSIDFGAVTIGESVDTTFTITNIGGGILTGNVEKKPLQYGCSYYFIISGQGSYSLACGESKTVTIRFAPTLSYYEECTIETGNLLCGDVTCVGKGYVPTPTCSLSTTFLDFGAVPVGWMAERAFTIYNTITHGEYLSGEVYCQYSAFEILSGGGGYSLPPGGSREVTVGFLPPFDGFFTSTIYPDGLTGGKCLVVGCIGQGYTPTPTCSLSTTLLDFGSVHVDSMARKTFTIYNVSTNGAYLSGEIRLVGVCWGFSILSGGGEYSLAPGESREVTVGFNPPWDDYFTCTIYPDWHYHAGNCEDVVCLGKGQGD